MSRMRLEVGRVAAPKIGTGLMRLARPCLIALAVLVTGQRLHAADLHRQFLDGLRERGYYDIAVLYLEQLDATPDLPAELRVVLPYEQAVTYLAHSRVLRNPEAQRDALHRADESLKRFVESAPDHPLAARASNERAQILLGQARVETALAESAADDGNRESRRKAARALIDEARAVFQQAHDLHQQAYQQFPTYIDPDDEERYDARRQAEGGFIRAQLDLAMCTYEKAHTYEPGSSEFNDTLNAAGSEFAAIHERYRTQLVGLHARMWQGKCFEEQQEIGKALGIYGELIGHRGGSPALDLLQDQVLQFRLICLNHPQKRDHALVVEEASRWLVESRDRQRMPIGIGIRWERARAFEMMAGQADLAEEVKQRYLRQALNDANEVRLYAGIQQAAAAAMAQRLNVVFNRESGDPKGFDAALNTALQHMNEIVQFKERLATVTDAGERSKLESDLEFRLKDAARLLELALQSADETTDAYEIHRARYRLAFVHYELQNSYDAAILAEFVARHLRDQDERLARDAAFLALAAFQQAYYAASEDNRELESRKLIDVGSLLAENWPQSEQADDARMTVGQMCERLHRRPEAAQWYGDVPESSPRYAEAQLAAGRVFWDAYVEASRLPKDEQPTLDELESWKKKSQESLQEGIKRLEEELSPDAAPDEQLIVAKISLSQILAQNGEYSAAVRLLSAAPQAPLQAIAVSPDAERPADGVQSVRMARLVYRLLLRSYVGTQQIDEALRAMDALEQVTGDSDQGGLAAVYVELGREIQAEIERLVRLDDRNRLQEVRASFDRFLDEISRRKQQMNYGALIWIAETYFGVAAGMGGDPASSAYFDKAGTTYEYILERAASEPGFLDDERRDGVRFRLVHCRRRQGRYADALQLVRTILQEKPRALDAQVEAAWCLQEWGDGDPDGANDRLLQAVHGVPSGGEGSGLWGWNQIALRLQRFLEAGTENADFRDSFLQARYNSAWCLHRYGSRLRDSGTRSEMLTAAKQQIEAFAVIVPDVSGPWWNRFDDLYRQVQRDLGQTPVPLSAPEAVPVASNRQGSAEVDRTRQQADPARSAGGGVAPSQSGRESSHTLWIVLAVLAACGIAIATFAGMRSSKTRRRAPAGYRGQFSTASEFPRSVSPAKASAAAAGESLGKRPSAAGRTRPRGSTGPPAS